MKGKLYILLLAFLFSVIMVSALSLPIIHPLAIHTNVAYENGSAIEGADISIVCNGNVSSGISDAYGDFAAGFSYDCEDVTYDVEVVFGNYNIISYDNICNDSPFTTASEHEGLDGREIIGDINCYYNLIIYPIVAFSGTVYNTTLNGSVVEGADVSLNCNGIIKDNVSDINGSYYFEFLESECNESSNYSVYAVKGDYNGSTEGLNVSDGTETNLAIAKPTVIETNAFSGIVYNTSADGDAVSGANVTITCNNVSQTNISDVNGSYYFSFGEDACNSSNTYVIYAESGDYNVTSSDLNVNDSVENVYDAIITKKEATENPDNGGFSSSGSSGGSSGSGSGGYVNPSCQDGYHFDFENGAGKCVADMKVVENETQNFNGTSFSEKNETAAPNKGFFSLMTGAVIGGGSGSGIAIAALIALVLMIFFIVWKRKNRGEGVEVKEASKENSPKKKVRGTASKSNKGKKK